MLLIDRLLLVPLYHAAVRFLPLESVITILV